MHGSSGAGGGSGRAGSHSGSPSYENDSAAGEAPQAGAPATSHAGAAGANAQAGAAPQDDAAGSSALGAGGAIGEAETDIGPLPPAVQEAIARVANGGEVDLDDDGTVDLVVRVQGDARVSEVMAGNQVLLLVTRHSDGTTEKSGDLNLDGAQDYTETEVTSDTGFARETEEDRDFDGVFDGREQYEVDAATGVTHTLREVREGEAWRVEAEGTNDTGEMRAGDGCKSDYPPAGDRHTRDVTIVGHLSVVQCRDEGRAGCGATTPKGACTRAQVERIKASLGSLFQSGLDALMPLQDVDIEDSSVVECLKRRQAPFVEALVSKIATGSVDGRPSVGSGGSRIACGVTCSEDASVRSLGNTNSSHRERVNVNMDQEEHELRDTLLHELIHSAGYEGAPGHNDENGNQSDSVYACARWCTGHSLKSVGADGTLQYDPEGKLDMQDCFRCSGTPATKRECCDAEGKYSCVGGCCDKPCAPDGTCKTDPCDPRLNGGDFSRCRFEGIGSLISADATVTADVSWVFDQRDGTNVTLVPAGDTVTLAMDTSPCSMAPMESSIAAGDGELSLAYGGASPVYTGFGNTQWTATVTCPDAQPQQVPLRGAWFAQESSAPFAPGEPITGSVSAEDGVVQWTWTLVH
jgi:hypothetical protein